MKNIYLTATALAALLLTASCAKDSGSATIPAGELSITATIEKGSKVSGTDDETASVIRPEWEEGDIIDGYYILPNKTDKNPIQLKVTAVDEIGVAILQIVGDPAPELAKDTELHAFYIPGCTTVGEDGTYALDWSQQDGALASVLATKAYMVADLAKVTSTGKVSLTFRNAMSIIKISGLKGNDGNALPVGTAYTITGEGLAASASLGTSGFSGLTEGAITTAVREGANYIAIPAVNTDVKSLTLTYTSGAGEYCWIADSKVNGYLKSAFSLSGKTLNRTKYNGYEYVDLGLTNAQGKKIYFAAKNIGAAGIADKGEYFKWGETSHRFDVRWTGIHTGSVSCVAGESEGKLWTSYRYSDFATKYKGSHYPYDDNGHGYQYLTKYITDAQYAIGDGQVDDLTILETADDAAAALWGGRWRMPTLEELLLLNGVAAREAVTLKTSEGADSWCVKYTSPDGAHSLIIPGTAKIVYTGVTGALLAVETNAGRKLQYWTTGLATPCYQAVCSTSAGAADTDIDLSDSVTTRSWGLPIRPVFTEE